jgi:hypothetical protein
MNPQTSTSRPLIPKRLDNAGLEHAYDLIAEAMDAAPAEKRTLFLAKLAFVLANLVGDDRQVAQAVEAASRDL